MCTQTSSTHTTQIINNIHDLTCAHVTCQEHYVHPAMPYTQTHTASSQGVGGAITIIIVFFFIELAVSQSSEVTQLHNF